MNNVNKHSSSTLHINTRLTYSSKLFRIKIKIRLKLKYLLLWIVFKTYHTYLTIDCLYLIKNKLMINTSFNEDAR